MRYHSRSRSESNTPRIVSLTVFISSSQRASLPRSYHEKLVFNLHAVPYMDEAWEHGAFLSSTCSYYSRKTHLYPTWWKATYDEQITTTEAMPGSSPSSSLPILQRGGAWYNRTNIASTWWEGLTLDEHTIPNYVCTSSRQLELM